ncbi:MAG: translation elongation factor Ts [Bacteroidales bacterium]|nr:translation elongation factor Ts [Bacteroidales bacterium]
MANITAGDVNKLRQMTGAGMMDCKNALVDSEGDFDKAIEILRKKGQKLASKRADRDASEGIVLAKTSSNFNIGAIIMLNCETDFVAKNQEFIDFANNVLSIAIENKIALKENLLNTNINGRSISDHITDLTGKIGEKIDLAHLHLLEAPFCAAYIHHGSKIASLVSFNKLDVDGIHEVGKNVAMQIAAMKPVAVDKSGVSNEIIEREIEIGKEQARQEGKPEMMIEKIAIGKLEKFYKENTLINQEYIKDGSMTVKQYLNKFNNELSVIEFKRLELGA